MQTGVSLLSALQVRERDLPMVMHTLSSEFTLLRVVNGEAVSAHNLGVTNGFVKPKLGEFESALRCCGRLQGNSSTPAPFKWQKLQKGKGVYVAGGAISETFSII